MKTFLSILLLTFAGIAGAQTAANWTVNDCAGQSHELFADLDAGKVAVIIWVMPCEGCIAEALTVQSEVKTAANANPGKIVFYMVDDYGNTNCNTLKAWAATNGITEAIIMTSKTVSMNPYGSPGMPKVVIAAGNDHKVYYNQNAPNITATGVKDALGTALGVVTGLGDNTKTRTLVFFPNPSMESVTIRGDFADAAKLKVEILSEAGKPVRTTNAAPAGGTLTVSTAELSAGTYIVRISDGRKVTSGKLAIGR